MFTIDAHLDLSMNAMEWNRDLRQPVLDIRKREEGLTDKPDRAKGTVALPALREGNIGLVVATQIARFVAPDNPLPGWHSPEQAWAQTQAQLAWYKAMEAAGEMVMIKDAAGLQHHVFQYNVFYMHFGKTAYKDSFFGTIAIHIVDAEVAKYRRSLIYGFEFYFW